MPTKPPWASLHHLRTHRTPTPSRPNSPWAPRQGGEAPTTLLPATPGARAACRRRPRSAGASTAQRHCLARLCDGDRTAFPPQAPTAWLEMDQASCGPGHGPGDQPSGGRTPEGTPGLFTRCRGTPTSASRAGRRRHTPAPRLGPNAAPTPLPARAASRLQAPRPQPALLFTSDGLLPGARGNLARTRRSGS